MMWLLVIVVGLPLVEISLFVTLGAWIGLWPTLLIVIGTALFGIWLIRQQGDRANSDLRRAVLERRNPAPALASDALNVAAGLLLVLPGFFTDACGFLLLLPPVKRLLIEELKRRAQRHMGNIATAKAWDVATGLTEGARKRPEVIDGTWEEVPEDETRPPSGWTRH